ncbi:MAG: hypothetical protein JNM18_02285 [Planctomycetaceae bacterium]|nr:hypothetical protein [Planctomycetaceae bacterium]
MESTLTALRNPLAGDAAFNSSDVARRAHELLPPEPSMAYQVLDGARYTKVIGQFRSLMTTAAAGGVPDAQAELIKALEKIFPTDQELEGILGVGVGGMQINNHGVVLRSVSDLPAP